VQPQLAVTASPPESQAANIATLAEMFPLMTEAALQSALSQCGGHLSSALDLLLTKDLVDSERHQQSLYTTRFRPICDLWVRGECSGGRAAACRDRHFYNDLDASRRTFTSSGKKEKRKMEGFSSPYRSRVVREKVEVVMEQVNVDSGNYEKWSEVQERELVDLTGNYEEEIIELSSDDESNAVVEMGSRKKETEHIEEENVHEECRGELTTRKMVAVEKPAKRKLRFGSENENEHTESKESEVLIKSLIDHMDSIKDTLDQTAQVIMNTEGLPLKRGKSPQNKEKNTKRLRIELRKTDLNNIENSQESKTRKKKSSKSKRNKGLAKSSRQQKTEVSVTSEQFLSKTNEGAVVNSKRSKQKKKSKRNKGETKSSKVAEKPCVPVKSEKCTKFSKLKVKSERKPKVGCELHSLKSTPS